MAYELGLLPRDGGVGPSLAVSGDLRDGNGAEHRPGLPQELSYSDRHPGAGVCRTGNWYGDEV